MTYARSLTMLLALILLLAGVPVHEGASAGGLTNGHAVAVSADGKRLVAGGTGRALYDLDPSTLEVKRRVYLGRWIQDMVFSKDGATLVVESAKAVQWLKYDTLEPFLTLEGAERLSVAADAGLVAVNERKGTPSIKLYDLGTGKERGAVPYDRRQTMAAFGLSPDGKRLALLYYKKRSEEEKKVGYKEIPKDLKGAALNEFKQRNDGYRAQYQIVDVGTGKPTLDVKLWYAAKGGGNRAYWNGDAVTILAYDNQNVRIDAKGTATYFELGNSYNYAMAADAKGAAFLTGGLRKGTRTTVDLKATAFELDALEGFPEYFKSFSFAADGSAYAGTTCGRVIRFDAQGAILASVPVY